MQLKVKIASVSKTAALITNRELKVRKVEQDQVYNSCNFPLQNEMESTLILNSTFSVLFRY